MSLEQNQDERGNPQPLEAATFPDALLRLSTASLLTGMSEQTLYRLAKSDPTFPRMIKFGTRCTRIRAGDLTAWLASKAEAREAA